MRNFLFAYFSFNKTATKNKEETIINIQIVDKFLIKINIEEIHYVVQEDKEKNIKIARHAQIFLRKWIFLNPYK